jgi:phosphoribosylformylglycinamidine synthase
MELPVVSGNVSFYNESPTGAILPTPTIGMVGIVKDLKKRCSVPFKDRGDLIILLGKNKEELGGSEYLAVVHDKEAGSPPELDLDLEKRVQSVCLTAIEVGIVRSAHDISDGGLAVALAESAILGKQGASIRLKDKIREDALLFGESQSRIILTIDPRDIFAFTDIAMLFALPFEIIGKVGGNNLTVEGPASELLKIKVSDLSKAYYGAIR